MGRQQELACVTPPPRPWLGCGTALPPVPLGSPTLCTHHPRGRATGGESTTVHLGQVEPPDVSQGRQGIHRGAGWLVGPYPGQVGAWVCPGQPGTGRGLRRRSPALLPRGGGLCGRGCDVGVPPRRGGCAQAGAAASSPTLASTLQEVQVSGEGSSRDTHPPLVPACCPHQPSTTSRGLHPTPAPAATPPPGVPSPSAFIYFFSFWPPRGSWGSQARDQIGATVTPHAAAVATPDPF